MECVSGLSVKKQNLLMHPTDMLVFEPVDMVPTLATRQQKLGTQVGPKFCVTY